MFHVKHWIKIDLITKIIYIIRDTTFIFETGQDWKIAALKVNECVCHFLLVGDNMNEKYMTIALKEAKKAFKKNEVPIGTVIIKNNKIIAKAHNQKEKTNIVTKHAEIIAIEKACKKLKTWHLNECILYTTVEPCLMCSGAIIQSRIKKVIFATTNEKYGQLKNIVKNNNYKIQIEEGILKNKSIELLQNFFNKKRK